MTETTMSNVRHIIFHAAEPMMAGAGLLPETERISRSTLFVPFELIRQVGV